MESTLFTALTLNEEANLSGGTARAVVVKNNRKNIGGRGGNATGGAGGAGGRGGDSNTNGGVVIGDGKVIGNIIDGGKTVGGDGGNGGAGGAGGAATGGAGGAATSVL